MATPYEDIGADSPSSVRLHATEEEHAPQNMINLGQKPEQPMAATNESSASYPYLSLSGSQLGDLGLKGCRIGDVYEIPIKIKVKSLSEDSASFDIIQADKATEGSEDEEEKQEPKEKKAKATVPPRKGPKIIRPPKDTYDEDDE